MNTARSPVLPALARHVRLPATREVSSSLLAALDSGPFEPEKLVDIVLADPAMVRDLIASAPLDDWSAFSLRAALGLRLQRLGADLLKVYGLSQLGGDASGLALLQHHARHALFVAEYAEHLATETHVVDAQQARLAGLLHDAGRLWLAQHAPGYDGILVAHADEQGLSPAEFLALSTDHALVGAKLARRASLPAPVADAIHLHHALPEVLAQAHPLAKVLWVAERMAGHTSDCPIAGLASVSDLVRLEPSTLLSLHADVTYLVAMTARRVGLQPTTMAQLPQRDGVASGASSQALVPLGVAGNDTFFSTALAALVRSAFADCGATMLETRFAAACRLLAGTDAPFMFVVEEAAGVLRPLPDARHPWLAALTLPCDDSASVIALALRTSTTTRQRYRSRGPQGSALDWQLARWLGGEGLVCEPWSNAHERGVAVFARDDAEPETLLQGSLRRALVDAVARRSAQQRVEAATQAHQAEALRLGYRFHAERLAGEARAPLATIHSELGRMTKRRRADPVLDEALNGLQRELERIGALLDAVVEPPDPSTDSCRLADLLEELRILHSEDLFATRGIQLDLRLGVQLPPVALPYAVMRDALLELFRFASDALPAGARYAVAIASPATVNGVSCGEIRLIDNGPGLPADAVAALFACEGEQHGRLALLRDRLAAHGATLICRSQAGTGTVFQLCLPLQPEP